MRKKILEESRRRQKKRRNFRIVLFLLFFLVLLIGAASFLNSQRFRIKNIFVEGNKVSSPESIKNRVFEALNGKYFFLLRKDSVFMASKKDIGKDITANILRVKSAELSKNFPDSLGVKIIEREPLALFCKENTCAFMDEDGFVFEQAPFYSGSVFVKFLDEREGADFSLNKTIIDPQEYRKLLSFSTALEKENIKTAEIILKPEEIFNLKNTEEWHIILDEKNNMDISLDNLKIALNEQIKDGRANLEYIDLRLENKVFFKFKQ